MKNIGNIIRIGFLCLFLFLLAEGKIVFWLILYGISLIAAIVFGRIYCGYICPMNTLMLPTELISKKLGIQTGNRPKWLGEGYFTWIALIASVAVMLLFKKLLNINVPVLPFWLAVSVIVTLKYKPAVFHNLICPFGALQKVFGGFTKHSETVEQESCMGCGICVRVCGNDAVKVSQARGKAVIDPALCCQCTNCQKACPVTAIHYRSKRR